MIYYVEDDENIRELALYALKQAGLEAQGFPSAEPFLKTCEERLPDLILLDIMLPHMDGMELLRLLRKKEHMRHIPIMMLTAKGTEIDKVMGLDAGADDYLAKPFGMMELVSRCKALLRRVERTERTPQERTEQLSCGPVRIDIQAHEVYAGDVPVELTLKEFCLLQDLIENQGHVLSRDQLLKEVWDTDFVGETRTVDTHVQTLRKKLNDAHPGAGDVIQTVRGIGYRAHSEHEMG